MNRRTFTTGLILGTGSLGVPVNFSVATARRHTNYYVDRFDDVTRLVPHWSPRSARASRDLYRTAQLLASQPVPARKLDRMLQLRDQTAALWQYAFASAPTGVEIGQTVHYLSHYKPPQVTRAPLLRGGRAWAQELGTDPASVNFANSLVNDGLANFTTALTITISAEAAGVAFEGASISFDALAGIFGQMAAAEGLDIAALGIGAAAVTFSGLALAAIGIGLIALALSLQNDDGSPGNVASCTTCDCTSSSACGVSAGDDGSDGGAG